MGFGYSKFGTGGGGGVESPVVITSTAPAQTPLSLKGAAGQTADLMNVTNSAGQTFFTIDNNGRVQLTNASSNGVFVGYAYVFQVNTAGGIVMTDGFGNTFFEYRQFKTQLIPRHYTASPASLAANQNDYAPGVNAGVLRLSSSLAVSITGFANAGANQEGDLKTMINVGLFAITLNHENIASLAGNRFLSSTGADIVLAPNQAVDAFYDSTTARWRIFKKN